MMSASPSADAERLALAFFVAGNRAAVTRGALRRMSRAAQALLTAIVAWPVIAQACGAYEVARVWRRCLHPLDRDAWLPTAQDYSRVLRLARAVDQTSARELGAVIVPAALLDSPPRGRAA
jgi:hypothetical protein